MTDGNPTVEEARSALFSMARYVDRAGNKFTLHVDALIEAVRQEERDRAQNTVLKIYWGGE